MKAKCDMKCEWKTWHDQRMQKWRSIRDQLCRILAWVGLCLVLFSIGYFSCWWRNDIARLEQDAALLPSTQQQVQELSRQVWDLRVKCGEITIDTIAVRNGAWVIVNAVP